MKLKTDPGRAARHDEADKFASLIETLSGVGGHCKVLQERCEEQRLEMSELSRQNTILRASLRKVKLGLDAAERAKDAPVALASDEEWLFHRNATLKFSHNSDGRRILVLRARGDKIVRLRDTISSPGQTTDLLKRALQTGRRRADGRSGKGKALPRKERKAREKRAAEHYARNVEKVRLREEAREQARSRQKESPNEALARRQDRLADINS